MILQKQQSKLNDGILNDFLVFYFALLHFTLFSLYCNVEFWTILFMLQQIEILINDARIHIYTFVAMVFFYSSKCKHRQ